MSQLQDMPFGISGMAKAETWFVNVVEEGPKGKEQNTYMVMLGTSPNRPMMCLCLTKEGSEFREPLKKFRDEFLRRRDRGGEGLPGLSEPMTTSPVEQPLLSKVKAPVPAPQGLQGLPDATT